MSTTGYGLLQGGLVTLQVTNINYLTYPTILLAVHYSTYLQM
jgi:hypothetical protein